MTGGIGAGKSTVSSTFSDLGGIVVDGDVIAREVVEPGTEGLSKLVDAFGDGILQPDGALNRPALAAVAFSDDEKRQTLNGIVHPLVAHRRSELIEAAGTDAIIVEDIPLLVESQMAPMFPLVIVVNADPDLRVRRLIEYRGFTEADARARIAAQATEEQRRAVADVWLDNSGSSGELVEKARGLWHQRILPFAHNLRAGTPAHRDHAVVTYDPTWPEQAQRIVARLNTACGHRAVRIDHIGSTAVPGMAGKDVIDIQITIAAPELADELADPLRAAGYPRVASITTDTAHSEDPALWHKGFHASADPGRPTNVHVRVDGRPNQQFALLFVDWLKTNPGVQADYLAAKRAAQATADYTQAKEPWFLDNYQRARLWAESTGWTA